MIHLCKQLERAGSYVIAKQLVRSATAIGASYAEATEAESADDFIHKIKIAMKEAKESRYWLELAAREVEVKDTVTDQLTSIQKLLTKSHSTALCNRNLRRRK